MNGYLHIIVVAFIVPSIQHYIPPPDMCLLANSCNHTWIPECGVDGNSSRKRLFLDNCDMYEYNCDNNEEYTKIDTEECPKNCTKSVNLNNYTTEDIITTPIPITAALTTSINIETKSLSTNDADTAVTVTPSMKTISSEHNVTIFLSTTLNTTNSTTTLFNSISAQSTSNSSSTASIYPVIQEELYDDYSRKTSPEISSSKTTKSTIGEIETPYTTDKTTLTESNITPQIKETTTIATTHTQVLPLTETVTSTTEKSKTTNKLISTNQVNMTSIRMNQTSVDTFAQNNFTISPQNTSNSSCTAIYPEIVEEMSDHDCSRKTTPEIFSLTETPILPSEKDQTTNTADKNNFTESFITPQIIETIATTQFLPLTETVMSTDNATELIETEVKNISETKTEFTSTTQINMTSIPINQTNLEVNPSSQSTLLLLNMTCNNYPKDCDRPITWETTAEGETRDFYQILRERFGKQVRLLRDTTHWPSRGSAFNIAGKKDSFLFGRHNDII